MASILVVDDDVGVQKLLKAFLEKQGCDVMSASTGDEALEQMNKRPSLVLLDIMMPDVHGLQVLNRIREISPDTPVIMMTGLAEHAIGLESLKRGAVDFVTKPFDLQHLHYLIQFHVLRSNSTDEA
jgi:two-component system, NtrC family, response regulator AtoC